MGRRRIIAIGAIVVLTLVLWTYTKQTQGPTSEKVLVTVSNRLIQWLDPIQCEDICGAREIAKVYDGLVAYHYLKRPHELVPNLAANMPTISADQRVYTFKLREGVQFHDNPCFPEGRGRELTAQDVVYSLKRLADPKNQAKSFWVIDGQIQGLNEWREKYANATAADYTEDIPGLQAIDQYTIQFRLTQPNPRFLNLLAMPNCYVVAQEAVEYYGAEFVNHPVGTGPFTLKAFRPQDSKIVYHKNPTFRDKYFPTEAAEEYQHMLVDYANQKLPFVDKIVTYILPEEQPRWLKFMKGKIYVVNVTEDQNTTNSVKNGELIPSISAQGIYLLQVPEQRTNYIAFNNAHPLFKNNRKLRQAMSLALDRSKYNQLLHNDTATMAQSTIPPGLAGYSADYKNPYCEYNVKKAEQYLAEAGYPDGQGLPIITLDVKADTAEKQQAELFQQCMKAIGIQVNVVTNTWPELASKMHKKATMMHVIGWSADYPDAQNFLQLFCGSDNALGLGAYFNDATFNALYKKAAAMPDSPERTDLYEKLNRMLGELVPVIFTSHRTCFVLYHSWVKNLCLPSAFCYNTEEHLDVKPQKK